MRRIYHGDYNVFPQRYPNGVVDSSGSSHSGSVMGQASEDICNPKYPFSRTVPITWDVDVPTVSWAHDANAVRSAGLT